MDTCIYYDSVIVQDARNRTIELAPPELSVLIQALHAERQLQDAS